MFIGYMPFNTLLWGIDVSNNRSPNNFHQNQGWIHDKSDVNNAAAKTSSLSVSMPDLDAKCIKFKPPDIKLLKNTAFIL